MYFVGAQDPDEWWFEWSPAWRFVGKHARWHPELEKLAVRYIRKAFGLDENGEGVPNYISVHIRRGDFTAACGNTSPDECFAPLSRYASRVSDVSATLHLRGISIPSSHILVTSDEPSPTWWDQVTSFGWSYTNHTKEQTEEKYGAWYPPLIDAVAQSLAVGFVGTDRSTMSLVASRRVQDWNKGVVDWVPLGK